MTRPLLLFTIDVEEDMPGWQISYPTKVNNANALPRLAEMCAEYGVLPTYLCTYPMVTEPESADILRGLKENGGCEIGTHLHPWNTPPFAGVPGRNGVDEREVTYYQYELGPELFRPKLDALHEAIIQLTGEAPISFRAGRFGIDGPTLQELIPKGYVVDSSVTPLEEHLEDEGPDFRSAPQHPYRPSGVNITRRGDLSIVEIPVSVGLTRRLPRIFAQAYVRLPKKTRVRGLLSKDYLRLIDFAWLYPARFELELMCRTARSLVLEGASVLNIFCHSNELVPGASGRVNTPDDVERVFAKIRGLLKHCIEEYDAQPATLGEAGRTLAPSLGL